MNSFDFVSRAAHAIDLLVPAVLIIASIATLAGNFAAQRFFGACGLGLRNRYRVAAMFGVVGVAFALGFRSASASTFMIALLLILSILALRAGSRRHAGTMLVIAAVLLTAEITAGGEP